jgi:solute carrier family 25, member 39/40
MRLNELPVHGITVEESECELCDPVKAMSTAVIHAATLDAMELGDGYLVGATLESGYAPTLDPRIVSGGFGSVLAALISQPFEVAKVKVQTSGPTSMTGSFGTWSTLRHVIAQRGVQGVYAGLAPTLIMSVPSYVLYLTTYDEIVRHLKATQFASLSPTTKAIYNNSIPVFAGAVARLIATSVVAPLETLRTRDASRNHSHGVNTRGVWKDMTTIVRTEGTGALYKGIAPSLGRDVPFAALYMICLERFRDYSRPLFTMGHVDTKMSTSREVVFEFINAALAGMVAATCTSPLDRVKTFKQSTPSAYSMSSQNMTTLGVIRWILRKEGIAGLWRGNQARMMKVAPQYAVMISSYEVGKKVLPG